MSQSYEEFERDYHSYLSRIRSYLASTRSRSTLMECERLLQEARKCSVALHGLAEIEGNPVKLRECQQRIERDVTPLAKEVSRALSELGNLTYQAPDDVEAPPSFGYNTSLDTERLLAYSEELLLESQALCAQSEDIGASTLGHMGRQREQLQIASQHLDDTNRIAITARRILRDMRNKGLRNKLVLHFLIVLLLVANGYVIYWLWTK